MRSPLRLDNLMATSVRSLENFTRAKNKHVELDASNAVRFINRDLSQLEFFNRVLHEGLDASQPVLERLKFMAILSANLDEFFMVRVSSLQEKMGSLVEASPDGLTRDDVLAKIRERVIELTSQQAKCIQEEIIPALAEADIVLTPYSDLSAEERESADRYYKRFVYPVITPQAVDPTHPFPYISGGSINLGVVVKPKLNKRVKRALKQEDREFFVRIKIPPFVTRFVPVGGDSHKFVLIEQIIAANIAMFSKDAQPKNCHEFRLTRRADIELREAEADDLLSEMEQNLKMRRFGDVSRLEVSKGMPQEMRNYLKESLEIEEGDIYVSEGPLNLGDAFAIAGLNRPDLKEEPLRCAFPENFDEKASIFDVIKAGDRLLHHPYQPYSIVTDLIREAVEDPDVLAIKMCLYRIGADSPIAPLLIEASERGKQVTALIEIKARFDEANNIEWGKKLEEAGVHVVYGLLGLKTHAKTTLIIRREGNDLKRYVHLATGNYNPATSTVYTDLGLLTCDEAIGADATEVFNYLTVHAERTEFDKLIVAPITLRKRMTAMIDREAENARAGKPARIIAKFNRLADAGIVNSLYEASQAGVDIDLIVRGVCTLRPGIKGLSENIRVRSVVGRLLEHSRVYYFENGGEPELYIGSSDWMPRNLDRRVEVLAPVEKPEIKAFLTDNYLMAYLDDNTKAWLMQPDGHYEKLSPRKDEEAVNAQLHFEPTAAELLCN